MNSSSDVNKIEFSEKPRDTLHAIAVSFDMSGFSKFCLQPTTHGYLNRYLSNLFKTFDDAFEDWWRDLLKNTDGMVQVSRPDFIKYTGDGAVFLWVRKTGDEFSTKFCTSAVSALRHFQENLVQHVTQWEKTWRVTNLPKKARFGIAIGPVHPLFTPDGATAWESGDLVDYAGYPINLAVRLQDHCPDVGFLIHAPLHPDRDDLVELIALKMKGVMDEPVYVFKNDYLRAMNAYPKLIQSKFSAPT